LVHHTVQIFSRVVRGRSHTHDNAQIPNLQFSLPTFAAYDFAAIGVGAGKFMGVRGIFERISETCQKIFGPFFVRIFSHEDRYA